MAATRKDSRLALGDLVPNHVVQEFCATDTVQYCITQLLIHGFSQAPVYERSAEKPKFLGSVSMMRMASAALEGRAQAHVARYVDHAIIHASSELISDVLADINRHGFVFVGEDDRVQGVLSASDVALKFEKVFLPFALFEVIETNLIRLMNKIAEKQEAAEIVDKLTMGQMRKKIELPENWCKLETRIDRKAFCNRLEWIVSKRNDLMHVRANDLSLDDLIAIDSFAKVVEDIAKPAHFE